MSGEAGVGERIFVRAVKARVSGKRGEPLKRAVHLLRRAFEQSAAAHREQGVADEGDAVLVEDQRDMAERVSGDFDHPADVLAEPHLVAFAERDVAAGNALGRGPEMRAPVASLIARLPPV